MNQDALLLGDIALESGDVLPSASLAFRTYGSLNASKDNVVLNPTWYGGVGTDNEWLFGPGRALDTNKYFIVVPEMFGNGVSSSPSNHPTLRTWDTFPNVSIRDNVRMQERLLREVVGVGRVRLAVGFSMGALQAYEWATLFPDQVDRLVTICGTARTSPHNWVFLEGVKAALTRGSETSSPRDDLAGRRLALRAVGRVYAGWALSQTFYRQELWRNLGFTTVEGFVAGFWQGMFADKDVDDLVTMLRTWQGADVSSNSDYAGDIGRALGAIKAQTTVMPSSTDLYFTAHDCQAEAGWIPGANVRQIESVFGHAAGAGVDPAAASFIEGVLEEVLK